MHKLGAKQSELIATGEFGSLLRLLSVKNQLIVALQAIEQQLVPFHAQDPETRVWSSPTARELCSKQSTECQSLLSQVMEMERSNEQKMTERRDQVAIQLQAAQSAGVARRAYQIHQRQAPHSSAPHASAFDTSDTTSAQLDLHSQV